MKGSQRHHSLLVLLGTLTLLPLLFSSGRYVEHPAPMIVVYPESPRPGYPVTVAFRLSSLAESAAGKDAGASLPYRTTLHSSDGRRIASVPTFVLIPAVPTGDRVAGAVAAAVLAIPNTLSPGPAFLRVEGHPGGTVERSLIIGSRDFNSVEIPLNQANTALRTEPDPRKTAESAELWRILSSVGTTLFHGGAFVSPTELTRRTGWFGDRRIFRYTSGRSDRAIHSGIDYGIPPGTPVFSCAAGRVALARYRMVTGYTVVVEHLPGVYSLYYHLDSIVILEGSIVEAGTLLGKSGNTGLSTGPHLHWELRVHGEPADPDAFIAGAVLDKDQIMSRITELASAADGQGSGYADRQTEGR